MQWIAVFAALFILDFIWARYNIATTQKRAIVSANYAAMIIILSGFSAVQYTHDAMLLIPAALGAWSGTACAICRAR